MAVDMFIKIKDIDGESRDDKHKNEIDVLAWSWGMENPGSASAPATGGGGGAGKANFQDLSITKWVDKATPPLMLHCASGKHIEEAVLTVRKSGQERPAEFYMLTLKNILVTSYLADTSIIDFDDLGEEGKDSVDRFVENVTLNFAAFKVKYTEFDEQGNQVGFHEFGWNIARNRPL